jgi:Ca-activated chloride channel family protein
VEEWVNAFDYGDPAPTDGDLGLTAETGLAPSLDDGTQLVRLGVTARDVDPTQRPRANVTLVVDRSGSMDIRERLGLVQSSLALLADRLDEDDTVSVVSFEDEARPILEPTKVRHTDRILDAVEELTPGGSTNLEAGLRLGYEQARDAFDPDAVNIVVLASDGVANVGDTGPGSITETIREEGAEGIHLVTVGYGMGNYNDHLMEQLADLGDGFYSHVDTYDEAEQLFGEDLVTTLTPVAAEARTQVTFDPERVTSYRLVGYDNRAIADDDFTDATVDAGELGAGHHPTALYEVRLADGVEPGEVIGRAAVRWTPSGPGGRDRGAEQEERVVDLVAAEPAATASDELRLAATVADLAQLLKRAEPYDERGLTLDHLLTRARALVDAGVVGADELVTTIEDAVAVG